MTNKRHIVEQTACTFIMIFATGVAVWTHAWGWIVGGAVVSFLVVVHNLPRVGVDFDDPTDWPTGVA